MLEIVLVIMISKKIAAMMKAKGRSGAGYVVTFVLLWFGGEIFGGIVGAVISFSQNPPAMGADGGFDFVIYGFALIGAAIGGTTGYLIANSVPAMEDPRLRKLDDFDKYEEEPDEGIRKRRRRSDPGAGSFEDGTGR